MWSAIGQVVVVDYWLEQLWEGISLYGVLVASSTRGALQHLIYGVLTEAVKTYPTAFTTDVHS